MSEWREVRLGEIAPFKYGKSKVASERLEGSFDVFSSSGKCGFSNDILADAGIIIGRKGSIGTVYYSELPFFCIDTAFYIDEIDEHCDIKFLYYYLKTIKLEEYNNDAAVPGLNRNLAHGLKVIIPKLKVQKKIVSILSTYDKLIENNNRRIQILEQTAEELYKEWFVRMRFPGYEKTKFHKGIPEGWEVKKLKDFAILSYGKQLPTTELTDKGYEVFGGNGVIGYYSEYMYKEQKILISCRGAASGEIVVSNPYSYITNNSLILDIQENLFEYMKQNLFYRNLKPYATGSAQPQITIRNIENLKFLIPLSNTLENFNDTNRKISNKILYLKKKNKNLVKQRDLLLPRLMNGTITVK